MTDDMLGRIERIEARQRLAQQHDPTCAYIESQPHWGRPDFKGGTVPAVMIYPVPCDCWLIEPVATASQTVHPAGADPHPEPSGSA
jgi:hypothetical protein